MPAIPAIRFASTPTVPGGGPVRASQITTQPRPVESYSQPAQSNEWLTLRTTQPEWMKHPWIFAHHINARAAVHVVPLIPERGKGYSVLLQVHRRPPFNGQLTVEMPSGLWGDKDKTETALQAASRELEEETGYKTRRSWLLSDQMYATSSGMATEEKVFALVLADENRGPKALDTDEQQMLLGELKVPLGVFTRPQAFADWLNRAMAAFYPGHSWLPSIDVPAAQGLLGRKRNGN